MNLILTGATGFVGSEALAQLAERGDVPIVTCLSRRPVPAVTAKVETILLEDFTSYSEDLARRLAVHRGCVWTLGGKASDSKSVADYEKVTCTFTERFVEAVEGRLTRPFRFCYLSGMGADPAGDSWFPWERDTRLLKGRVEKMLEQLTKKNPLFQARVFRPGGILSREMGALAGAVLSPIAVGVDRVARAMIEEALGSDDVAFRVLSNADIRERGAPSA